VCTLHALHLVNIRRAHEKVARRHERRGDILPGPMRSRTPRVLSARLTLDRSRRRRRRRHPPEAAKSSGSHGFSFLSVRRRHETYVLLLLFYCTIEDTRCDTHTVSQYIHTRARVYIYTIERSSLHTA